MDKLSEKKIEDYIECFGNKCPYCNSKNVLGESIAGDSGQLFQDISCDDCRKSWTDEYRLSGITALIVFHNKEELEKWKKDGCTVKEKAYKLTQKQIEDYIECFGDKCPYCNSKNFSAGSTTINSGQLFQDIWCNDCKKSWTDEYRLSGITEACNDSKRTN